MMRLLLILSLIFTLYSCEEYFMPDIEPQKSMMVFEGLITDEPGEHVVKISKTVAYNENSSFEKVKNFQVYFENDLGEIINLEEKGDGIYMTEENAAGIIGRSYRLIAISVEGKRYSSDFELLQSSAPIDTIYGRADYDTYLNYSEVNGYTKNTVRGLQVQNGFVGGGSNAEFYRYEYDMVMQSIQTYPYIPFPVYVYIARPSSSKKGEFLADVNCNNYDKGNVVKNPILFVMEYAMNLFKPIEEYALDGSGNPWDEDVVQFTDAGFLINLKQYSLSEKGYIFWNAIKKQSQASGQIFDPVQSQIYGNVTCEQDTNELVFGYFGASAITSKGMSLRLLYNDSVAVNSLIYFPELDSTIYSTDRFDFWVY